MRLLWQTASSAESTKEMPVHRPLRVQIKLHSERARKPDLGAGTQHLTLI